MVAGTKLSLSKAIILSVSFIPGKDELTKSPVNAAAKLLNPKARIAITKNMQNLALRSTFKFSPLRSHIIVNHIYL